MERRYFEFLYQEFCMAIDRRISRYELWLLVMEAAPDPSRLCDTEKKRFVDQSIDGLLSREKKELAPRARKRLRRRLLAFDSQHPSPEEWLTRLGDPSGSR